MENVRPLRKISTDKFDDTIKEKKLNSACSVFSFVFHIREGNRVTKNFTGVKPWTKDDNPIIDTSCRNVYVFC